MRKPYVTRLSEADRFRAKYVVNASTGCWQWIAGLGADGYGMFYVRSAGRTLLAHRVSYIQANGEIEPSTVLDHLCRNRLCVNPGHLEPVTDEVNILRGEGPTAINAAKTHCQHGHEFTDLNTRVHIRSNGRPWRACRTCARNYKRFGTTRVA